MLYDIRVPGAEFRIHFGATYNVYSPISAEEGSAVPSSRLNPVIRDEDPITTLRTRRKSLDLFGLGRFEVSSSYDKECFEGHCDDHVDAKELRVGIISVSSLYICN